MSSNVRAVSGGRNPPWDRDELVLALDLYLQAGQLDDADPRVVELSALLNKLPLHPLRPDAARFRNPNGVALKLANFAALDPHYPGRGMVRGGRGDREVWDALADQPAEVARLAGSIRAEAMAPSVLGPEEGEDEAIEGRLLFRRHRVRERDQQLARRKKERVRRETGRLACEVCSFDFGLKYGHWGEGFIECHHMVPLGHARGSVTTRLADLMIVCSNCHRVLHRGNPTPTVEDLRAVVARQ
jgi:5-methylcytosine-specific restriction enzyme A